MTNKSHTRSSLLPPGTPVFTGGLKVLTSVGWPMRMETCVKLLWVSKTGWKTSPGRPQRTVAATRVFTGARFTSTLLPSSIKVTSVSTVQPVLRNVKLVGVVEVIGQGAKTFSIPGTTLPVAPTGRLIVCGICGGSNSVG